ncbi:MAG: hypothetical protein ACRERD_20555, partial [Candidatus Binatia bacterium]
MALARENEGLRHDKERNRRDEELQDKDIIAKDIANRRAEALMPIEVREAELRVRKMEIDEHTLQRLGPSLQDASKQTRLEKAEMELVKSADRTPRGLELREMIVRSPIENEDDYLREVRALTDATRAAARLESIEAERNVIDYVEYLE